MQMVTGKCPECKEDILPAETQGQFNRNLGLHRRAKHGYRSPEYNEAKSYRERKKAKLVEPDWKAARIARLDKARKKRWREYKRLKRLGMMPSRHYTKKIHANNVTAPQLVEQTKSEAVQCNLPSCPVCGARFFVVKGG